MIKIKMLLIYIVLSTSVGSAVLAQSGRESSFLDNGFKVVMQGTSEVIYTEKLFLGPNTNWVIDGDMYIYSKSIWIAPTAKITGTGRFILKDPGENPYYQDWKNQASLIDGNAGNYINVNIVIDNPSNIRFMNMADPGFGIAAAELSTADLKVSANIDFNARGGDILLDGYQLFLGEDSQLLNAGNLNSPGRYYNGYVVTGNNPASVIIKRMKRGTKFIFPVGVDESSYSPAILTPDKEVDMHVGVVDYARSGLEFEDKSIGMDRVWKVLGDIPTQTHFTLVHESMTNGQAYVDKDAEIMQYSGANQWIGDVTKWDAVGIHTRLNMLIGAINSAESIWASKLSARSLIAVDDYFELSYADSYPTEENRFNILLNDIPGLSPIVPSSVVITKKPMYGSLVVNVDGTVTYTPDQGFVGEDTFEYQVADEQGRTSSAQVVILVKARDLKIPNVFTPNGDGKNDNFEIVGSENYDRIDLVVVNRWGNEVYRMPNYNNSWNGNGLNEGTYFYIIEAFNGNKKRVFKGDVLIKRN